MFKDVNDKPVLPHELLLYRLYESVYVACTCTTPHANVYMTRQDTIYFESARYAAVNNNSG